MSITIRELKSHADFEACVEMQKETWGRNFTEVVPARTLHVVAIVGSLIAGAFDAEGKLVGFVLGFNGTFAGRTMNWSQRMAVSKSLRSQGVGRRLKLFQREWTLAKGIDYVYWSYDPLVARNAHLNFNRLGVRLHKYVEDMYPPGDGSELHEGMSMDRFIVEWPLRDPAVEAIIAGTAMPSADDLSDVPIVNTSFEDGQPTPVEASLPEAPRVRIEVPTDIESILSQNHELAVVWRLNTRRAFTSYLAKGCGCQRFYREGDRAFYLMVR